MSDTRNAPSTDAGGHRCFVCGPANPIGLRLDFALDDDVCRARFTPGRDHVGWDGVTHGGILYSVLDDVMANWLHLQSLTGFTARCEIRYREPLPVAVTVDLEGRCVRRKGLLFEMTGKAIRADSSSVVAETTGRFMLRGNRS